MPLALLLQSALGCWAGAARVFDTWNAVLRLEALVIDRARGALVLVRPQFAAHRWAAVGGDCQHRRAGGAVPPSPQRVHWLGNGSQLGRTAGRHGGHGGGHVHQPVGRIHVPVCAAAHLPALGVGGAAHPHPRPADDGDIHRLRRRSGDHSIAAGVSGGHRLSHCHGRRLRHRSSHPTSCWATWPASCRPSPAS